MINPADASLSEKSRHLCSASYARPVWLPVFPSPSSWLGGAGLCTVPKHLNEKDAIAGSHIVNICELLSLIEPQPMFIVCERVGD